ncbi:hypothetical protein ACHAWO_010461 [Cyclotella atomus]|uniref:Uncharacterized protein n=1 Tax=Cyclotella atomus TaxID=382360 RepID=A0ABD3MMD9_9STRA
MKNVSTTKGPTITANPQPQMNQQQQQQRLQELTVLKSELTTGDTSGLVYARPSSGAAFLVVPRVHVLKRVTEEMETLKKQQT